MKTRRRLSDFQNDILWTTVFLLLAIISTVTIPEDKGVDYFIWFSHLVLAIIAWIVFIAKCIFVNIRFYEMYIFKVKIKEVRSNKESTKHYFKMLRIFFFFPIWYSDWYYSMSTVEADIKRNKCVANEKKRDYFQREIVTVIKK